jgi:threonine synthase
VSRGVRWISTRGDGPGVSFTEALFRGLAPDGGLYLPRPLDPMDTDLVLSAESFPELALAMARHLLAPLPDEVLEGAVSQAFDFPVRLAGPVGGVPGTDARPFLLELFHGPSMAFKDVGARFMAALMSRLDPDPDPDRPRTVLVATSGDTGGAVARAFHGLDGFRVVVLFPRGGVSEPQRRLFTTLGGNVTALAVLGSFDDCQAMVKEAFAATGPDADLRLTSANSINAGRLVPQTFYYAEALRQLRGRGATPGAVFSVPSGNLGNLTGGMMARRLGMPVIRLIAATNRNDAFRRWLEEGDVEARPAVSTPSNAMDVARPSNLERIRRLVEDDRDRLAREVGAYSFDDEATVAHMARVHQVDDYLVDPHSAVALLGAEAWLRDAPGSPPVVALGTAHPAKFPDVIRRAIGRAPAPPARLDRARADAERVATVSPTVDALLEVLQHGARAP